MPDANVADLNLRLYEDAPRAVEATLLSKAATEQITEQGMFTAIAAAYTVDRDNEKIRKGAFANTIKAWSERNKPIPLHWAHKGDAENVIGHVDPKSMKEIPAGLYVEGHLDLENSEVAREAWRLVKANTVGLSFGFLAEVTPRAKDGTREIVNIDLYEISITPAPANPDTRFLSLKSVDVAALEQELLSTKAELAEAAERLTVAEKELADLKEQKEEQNDPDTDPGVENPLRKQLEDLELEFSSRDFEGLKPPQKVEVKQPDDLPSLADLHRQADDLMLSLLSEGVDTT